MVEMIDVPFGEWLPDMPSYNNPGLVEASGVYPVQGGYGPFSSVNKQSATTTEPVVGAEMIFDNSGNAVIVGGSATRLFTDRSGIVTETTPLTSTDEWRFTRFDDLVVGVSFENDPQYLTDIDTDDTWSTLSDAPKAAQIGVVDDFLVLGDLVDIEAGSPTVPHRLRWSAKNDPTASWATDRATLASYRDLDARDGRITAIVGGRFGLIFQERAIRRMEFVGAPRVFEFPYVATDRGAVAGSAAVSIGDDTYFLSQDGFYRTNGSDLEAIGGGRVNEWFSDNVDDASIKLTHGAINWPAKCIVWAFYSSGAAMFDKLIIYNFVLDRWSACDLCVHYLVQTQTNAETLGSLATTYATLGDAAGVILGEKSFRARDLGFAAYVEDGNGSDFARLDGTSVAATFLTGDAQLRPGRRSRVTGVWPGVETEGTTITTRIRSRSKQGGMINLSAATTAGVDGFCPHNVDDWLHAVREDIPAGLDWAKATHVQARVMATGRR
jgi:hypothetical protein